MEETRSWGNAESGDNGAVNVSASSGEEGSVDVVQVGSDEVGPTGKEERWAQRREQHQHGNTCHQHLSDRPAGADEILATASSRP
ncbi:hypothetical protein CTAM01_08599 [Colletotrichum tamarilloi]|uniref:Uncharacterized protein n=1 Tax=Colletotrichum tamarilloi TaxID=1209934 RepID=A0ABQ9R5X3_9PEZI|nr:uncharacterized protein CTAM01_08599 [Colletotrichum tamarilloi]KAK1495470.1 hypothetical protein CTAM01_08599 [Colletotrichum tamarilloi]